MANRTSIRFIHSSDWQLGMTRAFLTEEAASRFNQARIDAIAKLGELAIEHEARFILVAGDVFESNQLSRQTVLRTLNALSALPVPILLLPGNHDPLDGSSIFDTKEFLEAPEHIIVIRDTSAISIPKIEDVEIFGAPWPTKHPSSDLCSDLVESLEPSENVVRIIVAHGQVDSLAPDTSRPDIITLDRVEPTIESGSIHYIALGDRHSVKQVGDTGRIWYSGAPLVTAFDEVEPNKALLVELEFEGGCEVKPLDVGKWEFIAKHFVVNGMDDLEQLSDWLAKLPNKERTAIKIGFEGSINLTTDAALEEIMETNSELFASLRKRERTSDLVIVPDSMDQDSVDLVGYAKEAWDELVLKAQNDDEAAKDALKLFYRLNLRGLGS
jgi:DNA repair exonuclease SbcCD nuclease subunit